jgi:hypothetical protein
LAPCPKYIAGDCGLPVKSNLCVPKTQVELALLYDGKLDIAAMA